MVVAWVSLKHFYFSTHTHSHVYSSQSCFQCCALKVQSCTSAANLPRVRLIAVLQAFFFGYDGSLSWLVMAASYRPKFSGICWWFSLQVSPHLSVPRRAWSRGGGSGGNGRRGTGKGGRKGWKHDFVSTPFALLSCNLFSWSCYVCQQQLEPSCKVQG